uniref:BED-type domain-containing protein n=1 Tax=Ditylenchus dipsaci TaxID=166011 RepID=A0A915EHA0_9BILA
MTMYLFKPQEFARLYNCNHFYIEEVPFEKRQHTFKSIILIFLSVTYYILYIPCIISIYKHRENSCYKILLFISITNVLMLCLIGFLHAYLSLIGAVYCTSPTLIYLAGVAVTDINKNYINVFHSVHDLCIAAVIPAIYGTFFIILLLKMKSVDEDNGTKMFVQISIVSSLNCSACTMYVYMNYYEVTDVFIYFTQFFWFHIHGLPPVIYVALNKTIRDDCKQMDPMSSTAESSPLSQSSVGSKARVVSRRGQIWSNFTEEIDATGCTIVVCRECKQVFKHPSMASTLSYHWIKKHPNKEQPPANLRRSDITSRPRTK